MTDNEIIKALEHCTDNNALDNCDTCPLCDYGNCQDTLIKYCSNTINRQKAEIERNREIIKYHEIVIAALEKSLESGKSEAIREYAEKLKTEIAGLEVKSPNETYKCGMEDVLYYRMPIIINNLAKEMTEGGNV